MAVDRIVPWLLSGSDHSVMVHNERKEKKDTNAQMQLLIRCAKAAVKLAEVNK